VYIVFVDISLLSLNLSFRVQSVRTVR